MKHVIEENWRGTIEINKEPVKDLSNWKPEDGEQIDIVLRKKKEAESNDDNDSE